MMYAIIFMAVMALLAWNFFVGMFSRSAGTKFTKSITWGIIVIGVIVFIAEKII